MLANLALFYKNLPYYRKLLLSFVVLLLMPILVLSAFTYNQSRRVISDQALQMATQSTRRAVSDFDELVASTYRMAQVFNQNNLVREILEKDPAQTPRTEQIADFRYLDNLVESLKTDSPAAAVRLYVPNGTIYANQALTTDNLDALASTAWYRRIVTSSNALCFDDIQPYTYLLQTPRRILPSAFPLFSLHRYQRLIGVVRIDYAEDTILNLLRTADFTGNGGVLLLNEREKTVASATMAALAEPLPALDEDWQTIRLDGNEVAACRLPLAVPGWHLVTLLPMEHLLLEASALRVQIALFALAIGVAILLLSAWTASYNSRRLGNLAQHMKRAQAGDWDTPTVVDSEDEIGVLQYTFNYLMKHTKQVMQEKYELGHSLKNMELIALQNQINPHFLYNTLDLIHWSAQEGDSRTISAVVDDLSKYYRLSLSQGRTFVTIADELSHVIHYANIQNYRFQGGITLQLRVAEAVMPCPCLKLTLQPLVENAILHGILEKPDKQGIIRITGEIEENNVILKVIDNGVGMTEEKLRALTLGGSVPGRGYGVWNVHQRLRLHYGEDYGLSYESHPELGTAVTVTLPFDQNRQEQDRQG